MTDDQKDQLAEHARVTNQLCSTVEWLAKAVEDGKVVLRPADIDDVRDELIEEMRTTILNLQPDSMLKALLDGSGEQYDHAQLAFMLRVWNMGGAVKR